MPRLFHQDNTTPRGHDWVFVFGSNLAGRHGAGAAKVAHVNFGAKYGVGAGPTGRSYAIPTKDRHLKSLSLDEIRHQVTTFIEVAKSKPKSRFYVTRIGCGLAGYADADVAPMFASAPMNCSFPEPWREHLTLTKTEI